MMSSDEEEERLVVVEDEEEDEEENEERAEALVLVAEYLRRGTPCSRAAAVLCEEIEEHGLLGSQRGWDGRRRLVTVESVRRRYSKDLLLRQLRAAATQQDDCEPLPRPEVQNRLGDAAIITQRAESPQQSLLWPAPVSERAVAQAHAHIVQKVSSEPYGELATALTQLRRQHPALPFRLDDRALTDQKKASYQHIVKPQRRATLSGHRGYSVYCVAFDKTGEFVITGADDHLVKVWHANTCRLRSTLRGHRSVIADLSLSYDNSCLASGSEDGTVRLWRLHDGKCISVLTVGPKKPLHRSDTASRQNTPHVRDRGGSAQSTTQQEPAAAYTATLCAVSVVKFDPYGSLYAAATDCPDVRCWDAMALFSSPSTPSLVAGTCWPHLDRTGHNDAKLSALCVGSELGATGTKDGTLRLWKLYTSQDKEVYAPLFEAESALKNLIETNATEHQEIRREPVHYRSLKDRLIKARESIIKAVCLHTVFDAHGADLTDLDFSYKSDRLLSASMQDCTAKIWAWITHGSPKIWRHACLELDISGSRTSSTKTSSNGISSSSSSQVHTTPLSARGGGGKKITKRELTSVAWSHDDRLVFVSSFARPKRVRGQSPEPRPGDQRIDIFEALNGNRLRSLLAHTWDCFALAPHPQSSTALVTGGHDGALRFWEIDSRSMKPAEDLLTPPDDETQRRFLDQEDQERQGAGRFDRDRQQDGEPSITPNAAGVGQRLDGRATASSECWAGEIWSATWSSDGSRLAAVDLVGQLHLFGPGGTVQTTTAPRDQYLASDYAELVWDDHLYALDATTRVAPHLAPREFARNFMRQNHASGEPLALVVDARDVPHRPHLPAASIAPALVKPIMIDRHDLTKATLPEVTRGTMYTTLSDIRKWWPDARELAAATADMRETPAAAQTIVTAPSSQRRPSINSPRALRRRSSATENALWITIDEDQPNAGADFDDQDDDEDFDAEMHDDDEEDDDADEVDDDELPEEVQTRRRTLRQAARIGSRAAARRRRRAEEHDIEDDDRPVLRSQSRRPAGDRLGGDALPPRASRRTVLGAAAQQRVARQQRRRVIDDDEVDDELNEDDDNDDESEDLPPRRATRQRQASTTNRRSTRRVVQYADQDSEDSDLPRRRGGRRRPTRSPPPARRNQRGSSRRALALDDEVDDDDEDEEEAESSLDMDSDSPEENAEDDDEESDDEDKIVVVSRKKANKAVAANIEYNAAVVRDWVRLREPALPEEAEFLQYTPQLGDEVVYIPQGHAANAVELGTGDVFTDEGPPWRENALLGRLVASGGHGAIACRVVSIQYELPNEDQPCRSVVAWLELQGESVVADVSDPLCADFVPLAVALASLDETLNIRPRRASRRDITPSDAVSSDGELRFIVPFRRCDTPEFIVPRSRFEQALNDGKTLLTIGAKANFPMINEDVTSRYPCTVNEVSFKAGEPRRLEKDEAIDSDIIWDPEGHERAVATLWEGLKITCDDGSEYRCSPWEIEPQRSNETQIWPAPTRLGAEATDALLQAIELAARDKEYDDFFEAVVDKFPQDADNYLESIAAPIELELMRDRLASGYYRQLEAFEDDVQRLARNCSLYTGPNSQWTKKAEALRDSLLSATDRIRNPPPEALGRRKRRLSTNTEEEKDDDSPRPRRTKRQARLRTGGTGSAS